MFSDKKEIKELRAKIDMENLPNHIAIIMDGNGRWAKKRFLPRTAGHKQGVETVKEIVELCGNMGVKHLTLYAFSTENWKRPKEEVGYLMKLLVEFLRKELMVLHKNDVRIKVLGEIERFEDEVREEIEEAMKLTKENKKLILNIALNYGGRDEVVKATKEIAKMLKEGKITEEDITEELISDNLYTKNQPDPDLMIRTSGEIRLSNFLIYQNAYSEFYFTDVYWPDFRELELYKAILEYQRRHRRYGGL